MKHHVNKNYLKITVKVISMKNLEFEDKNQLKLVRYDILIIT